MKKERRNLLSAFISVHQRFVPPALVCIVVPFRAWVAPMICCGRRLKSYVNQVLLEVFREHSDSRAVDGRLENRSRPWMVN